MICVHAIFSHGRDSLRKVYILREAMTWHDDEAYYEGRSTGGRFLRFEPNVPARLQDEGGFALVEYQVQQFHAAARLSRLLNRTIVLPRLRCGDRTLAFTVPPPDGLAPDVFRALPELVFLEDADAARLPALLLA